MDLSVCMVSFNCRDVLSDCLKTIPGAVKGHSFEVILVDNNSEDDSIDVARAHPWARVIQNQDNVGFTVATNQAIEASSGRHLLWLNTDTVLSEGCLDDLVDFLDANPSAGIAGPKVLNADGSFQPQCKRGEQTPVALLCYQLKLDRLLPKHPVVGQYLLRYIPEDEPACVTAVSGCCLMARREVYDQVGPLDESMFAYGEDVDWCYRANQAGWEVWYRPESVIHHLKGKGGTQSKPYLKLKAMHRCMERFCEKHLASRYSLPTRVMLSFGIKLSCALSILALWLKRNLMGAR